MEFLPITTILQLKSQHAYMVNLPGCDNYRSTRPRVPFHFQILNQLLGRDVSLPQVLELATETNSVALLCFQLLQRPPGGGGGLSQVQESSRNHWALSGRTSEGYVN